MREIFTLFVFVVCLSANAEIISVNLRFTEEGYWYAKGYNHDSEFPKNICEESYLDCDQFNNPAEMYCFFHGRLRKNHPVLEKLNFWKYVKKYCLQVDKKKKNLMYNDIQNLQQYFNHYRSVFEKISKFFGISKKIHLDLFYSRIDKEEDQLVNAFLANYVFRDEIYSLILANEFPLNDSRFPISFRVGLIAHELSHAMLAAKFGSFEKFEKAISEVDEPNSYIVSKVLNEALATVLGNIIVQEKLSGKKVDWKKEEYCTYGFANALKDLTSNYLNNSKPIDECYIREAIRIFNKIFPNSSNDPRFFLRNYILVGEGDAKQKSTYLMSKLMSGSYEYYTFPAHKFSADVEQNMNSNRKTLIIVYSREQDLQKVKRFIPAFDKKKCINIIPTSHRTYLILKVDKKHSFEDLIDTLLSKK